MTLPSDPEGRRASGREPASDVIPGDRDLWWRRTIHVLGALVLLYYVLPSDTFVIASTTTVLLFLLAIGLTIELLRHTVGLKPPLIRPYEEGRVASFAWYAIALTVALLAFPPPIATTVILGAAFVDPLIGELRRVHAWNRYYPSAPIALYLALSIPTLYGFGRWSAGAAILGAALATTLAIAVERKKSAWFDDDWTMVLIPGAALTILAAIFLGLPP